MRGKESIAVGIGDGIGITPAYAGKSDLTSGTQTLLQGSPPHMRGKAIEVGQFCALGGITPHVRGKAELGPGAVLLSGITPAYAGKRGTHSLSGPRRWDHPRVCGEKGMLRLKHSHKLGSPPRMRGKG